MHLILADATSDQSTAMFAAMSAFMGVFLLVALAITVLTVWFFWRIFEKAGYSGALGLLCLIPSFGFLICILILAFGQWPRDVQTIQTIQTTAG